MPDGFDIAQRGGFRGGFPRGGFPRGGFPRGGFPGRFPMRFPGRFRMRRFPRFFFFPFFPVSTFPPGCDFIDQFGRCCDRFGRCFGDFDFFGGADPQLGGSADSVAAWSPSDAWESIDESEMDDHYY